MVSELTHSLGREQEPAALTGRPNLSPALPRAVLTSTLPSQHPPQPRRQFETQRNSTRGAPSPPELPQNPEHPTSPARRDGPVSAQKSRTR